MQQCVFENKQNTEPYAAMTKSGALIDGFLPDLLKVSNEIESELGFQFNFPTSGLEKELRLVKKHMIIAGTIRKAKEEFPQIYFNERILIRAGYYLKPFNGETFLNHIRMLYKDAPAIALEQMRYAIISEAVPGRRVDGEWQSWDKRTAENIVDINKAGIELHFNPVHFDKQEMLDYVIKFINFAVSKVKTEKRKQVVLKLKGMKIKLDDMDAGIAYPYKRVKSVRFFCGDTKSLKINFKNPADREKFKEMLFTPTWKLLGESEPEPEPAEYKDACDICLFKDVSCLQCNGYDHWVGSCKFCTKNIIYPTKWDRDSECEKCKGGEGQKFDPIKAAKNATGLVREYGYCKNVWIARTYKEELYLKIMCLGWGIGAPYKAYRRYEHPARPCISCRACVTEYEEGIIKQVCTSERPAAHIDDYRFVYNCRGTLATMNEEQRKDFEERYS